MVTWIWCGPVDHPCDRGPQRCVNHAIQSSYSKKLFHYYMKVIHDITLSMQQRCERVIRYSQRSRNQRKRPEGIALFYSHCGIHSFEFEKMKKRLRGLVIDLPSSYAKPFGIMPPLSFLKGGFLEPPSHSGLRERTSGSLSW